MYILSQRVANYKPICINRVGSSISDVGKQNDFIPSKRFFLDDISPLESQLQASSVFSEGFPKCFLTKIHSASGTSTSDLHEPSLPYQISQRDTEYCLSVVTGSLVHGDQIQGHQEHRHHVAQDDLAVDVIQVGDDHVDQEGDDQEYLTGDSKRCKQKFVGFRRFLTCSNGSSRCKLFKMYGPDCLLNIFQRADLLENT